MPEVKNDHDFKMLLDSCYFHSSREYPSDTVKNRARMALTVLWQVSEIEFSCLKFSQTDIRRIIVEEMMPEDLDRAIDYAEKMRWEIKFSEFVLLVFICVLFSDTITQAEFEMTFNKNVAKKISNESEVK